MYKITNYSYQQAQKLGVIIKPSTKKNKKIDVYDSLNNYLCSIGDIRYSDYPTYILSDGLEYANNRRRLYRLRHKNEADKPNTAGYFAYYILW